MKIPDECVSFWKTVEGFIGVVPSHIKNILRYGLIHMRASIITYNSHKIVFLFILFSVNGYHTAVTIKTLNERTLSEVENFTRQIENLLNICDNGANMNVTKRLLFGSFANNSQNFCFDDDEKKTICKIVEFVQQQMRDDQEDYDYFIIERTNMETIEHRNRELCTTSIGELFRAS